MGIVTGTIIGGLIGLGAINVMALIAKNSGKPNDQVNFSSDQDVFSKVDAWAQANGYRLVRNEGDSRVYQKGKNFLTSPMFLEVHRQGQDYAFKSYVQVNGLIIKGDMALTGDGFMAKLPRSMAKKVHNELFSSLGQPGLA
ncbi:MAG: hypothetical protein ACREO0_08275 [Pseudoxanthomonas sp.]